MVPPYDTISHLRLVPIPLAFAATGRTILVPLADLAAGTDASVIAESCNDGQQCFVADPLARGHNGWLRRSEGSSGGADLLHARDSTPSPIESAALAELTAMAAKSCLGCAHRLFGIVAGIALACIGSACLFLGLLIAIPLGAVLSTRHRRDPRVLVDRIRYVLVLPALMHCAAALWAASWAWVSGGVSETALASSISHPALVILIVRQRRATNHVPTQ
jgi:hypothetical protein